ncbi:L-ectoine synthase [Actinidia chinensis var. chinensis]|uniref:L-ectoine synthase n=1 Tax=Actinidia chinensis var. chinensis TaxID=1590841 RepID=A0A2R6RRC8_ACTCC|nr:L-ectoine synthase [Actinidia chinensis var. chinensis]
MMKGNKQTVLTFAEKCKNILASNWQGNLNTIKADAKGSKEEIYTSKVKYFVKKGRPYIWVPEKDLHNVNAIIDERGSFAVASPFPGPLANLLRSIKKVPAQIALTGDVVPLKGEKVKLAAESLRETISSERKAIKESTYSVSGILSSSNLGFTPRSENLQELLDGNEQYVVYKFNLSSCTYVDSNGGTHEVDLEHVAACKADPLSPFSSSLIDGINQSEMRRRALILFCITYLNRNAKDAFMLSVDRKGFDVLGKVLGPVKIDGSREYQWKEFRFTFKEEARDLESLCRQLVEMEEEALKNVSSFSGLG